MYSGCLHESVVCHSIYAGPNRSSASSNVRIIDSFSCRLVMFNHKANRTAWLCTTLECESLPIISNLSQILHQSSRVIKRHKMSTTIQFCNQMYVSILKRKITDQCNVPDCQPWQHTREANMPHCILHLQTTLVHQCLPWCRGY